MNVPASLAPAVFIEIFSGSGNLSRAVAKENGWPCLLWDINLGPEYDLRCVHNRHKIAGWMRSGRIRGGHLGTPCHTFTQARDRPPGPPPLRSSTCPLGLPDLSPDDRVKVNEGNMFMLFSVTVLNLALALQIFFSMENPTSSRLWLCPAVARLLRKKQVHQQQVEFCMFGAMWRKSTRFVSVHFGLDPLSHYRCIGARRGCCTRSGKRHFMLAGQNEAGQWWTKIAEPYPHRLCTLLAQCFLNAEVSRTAERFQRRLQPESAR